MSDTDLTIETIARLTKQNAELRTQAEVLYRDNVAMSETADTLRASNARLRDALERYGEHRSSCSVEFSVSAAHPGCDCGLREALEVKP